VTKADDLVTIGDVADELKVGDRFVRRLIFEKRIAYHKIGRHLRISRADLDAFKREPPGSRWVPLECRCTSGREDGWMSEKRLPPGIRLHPGRYQVRYYGTDGKRLAQSFKRLTDAKRFQRDTETDKDRGAWLNPRDAQTPF